MEAEQVPMPLGTQPGIAYAPGIQKIGQTSLPTAEDIRVRIYERKTSHAGQGREERGGGGGSSESPSRASDLAEFRMGPNSQKTQS